MVTAACGGESVVAPESMASEALRFASAIGTDPRTGATIETDKDDYAPGEVVHLNGRGWAPNETVHLFMTEDPDTHGDVSKDVVADASGAFTLHFYDVELHDIGVTFTLTATGATSGSKATVVFYDGNVTAKTSSNSTHVTIAVSWRFFSGNANCSGSASSSGTTSNVSNSTTVVTAANAGQSIQMTAPATAGGQSFVNWKSGSDTRTTTTICVAGSNGVQNWDANYQLSTTPPLADAEAGADPNAYAGDEGSAIAIAGSGSDPDGGAAVTFLWTAAAVSGTTGSCSFAAATSASTTVTCTDNGSYTLTLKVTDDENTFTTSTATLAVANVAPSATFNAPASANSGAQFQIKLESPTDPSSADVTAGFTYAFDCGSGTFGTYGTTATATCTAGAPGAMTVKGKIKDKDGAETTYEQSVAVNNLPPSASAGGPYSGNEGSAISITGTGSDPDGGSVTYAWSIAPSNTTCTIANASAASTSVTCNDDGSWNLTLTVTDDENVSTTSSAATLTVANVAPTLGPVSGPASVFESASTFSFSVSPATDPSSVDAASLEYAYSCDDGATFGAWSAAVTGACVAGDGPGTVTVAFKARDKDLAESTVQKKTVTVTNVAPTATFGNNGPVNEGSPFTLTLTNPVDVPADLGSLQYAFDCGSGYGAFGSTASMSCPTTDNGTRSVKGKVQDKDGGVTEYTASVTVNNVAPTLHAIGSTVALAAVNQTVNITLDFTDPAGTNDTYQAVVDWDDNAGFVTVAGNISSVATVSRTFSAVGVYRVCAKVQDEDGGVSNALCYEYLVVYDPTGGFVTGGGWINSPAGAYRANTSLTGKATFGFVSKYLKGANTPTGNTEFQFHAGGLNFSSSSYQWLVVSGNQAQYKGTGTLNGVAGYNFLVSVKDGSPDKFRIKITDANGVVYDNQVSGSTLDDAEPATALGGGSIVIHTK